MNVDSEQLRYDTSVTIAPDQPLRKSEIIKTLKVWLGDHFIKPTQILGRKVYILEMQRKTIILLVKAVTYLGNPHPIYKKRIQLSDWYQDFCKSIKIIYPQYDIRFMGIYHYDENVIFVDFLKDTYLSHGLHNSSAHVSINDLYEGMTYGIFQKTDKFGNKLFTIRNDKLKEYFEINSETKLEPLIRQPLFEIFNDFNKNFPFGKLIYSLQAIHEMKENSFSQWKQAEWAGWYLEYRFSNFIVNNCLELKIIYTGLKNKKHEEPDFDLKFVEEDFYGDLKASDVLKKEAPGNDQKSIIDCIYKYNKFWYIIYEHETIKDSDMSFEATKARNTYIKIHDLNYKKDEMSYSTKMKHSVKFIKMSILELNKVNFRNALKIFNQGHQPGGQPRLPKFNIDKRVLENDNYVVYRYNHVDIDG